MTSSSSVPHGQPRVLSVQSSVVAGHVGNKSAVFPMQLLGFDVDVLNTVQFSNHTGYGSWGGDKMTPQHLESCFDALDRNGLLRHTHLLTGYTPGAEALDVTEKIVKRLREVYPDLTYVLDPVMGDDGKMYVSESVPPVYRRLLRYATCATPNDFEASLLTSIPITSISSVRECLSAFHTQFQIPHVIISSASLQLEDVRSALGTDTDARWPEPDSQGRVLVCAGSSKLPHDSSPRQWAIVFPRLAEHYEGVGDLFSSLVLARFPSPSSPSSCDNLASTAEMAIASLESILLITRARALEYLQKQGEEHVSLVLTEQETKEDRVKRLRAVELRLVDRQSREAIERPLVRWRARPL